MATNDEEEFNAWMADATAITGSGWYWATENRPLGYRVRVFVDMNPAGELIALANGDLPGCPLSHFHKYERIASQKGPTDAE